MSEFRESLEKLNNIKSIVELNREDWNKIRKALQIADKLSNESEHPSAVKCGYIKTESEYYAYNKGVKHMKKYLEEIEG